MFSLHQGSRQGVSKFRQKLLIAALMLGACLNVGCQRKLYDDRPKGVEIDTVVIHSIKPGGKAPSVYAAEDMLRKENVSAHYIIGRDGEVREMVDEDKRAWHAGESQMPFKKDNRSDVNDFSIGIELVTTDQQDFTDEQYEALIELITEIRGRYKVVFIVGHQHIAGKRKEPKTDPGSNFEWGKLVKALNSNGEDGEAWVYNDKRGMKLTKVEPRTNSKRL